MRRLTATMIPAACAVLAVTAVAWADTYFDTNYHSGYLSLAKVARRVSIGGASRLERATHSRKPVYTRQWR